MVIRFPHHPEWSSAAFSKTLMSFDRDYYSLLLPSRDNQVRWHVETNYGDLLSSPSRDNQVWWHAETNYGHLPPFRRLQCLSIETITVSLCLLETIKYVGTRRQIMVIRFPRHPETIKSVGTRREIMVNYPHFEDFNVVRSRLLQCRSVRRCYLATFSRRTITQTSLCRSVSWFTPS